jgi:hypothetical protein
MTLAGELKLIVLKAQFGVVSFCVGKLSAFARVKLVGSY